MLKNKRLAYDGRGNVVVPTEADAMKCFEKLGGIELYAEEWISFTKELAVMIVRTGSEVVCYPVVETIQRDNICHMVRAPALISDHARGLALDLACCAVGSLQSKGIFGVELFLLDDDTVLINEIAPRLAKIIHSIIIMIVIYINVHGCIVLVLCMTLELFRHL